MSNRKPIISTLNVDQNRHCNLDESGHVSRKSRRTCWKMPEYDEKMDYILFEDYDLIHEDDKWVLIEDMKIFQSIIEDFMQSPVSSEKEIRTKQMSKDVQNFLLRQQSLKNYDNLIKNVENLELSQISKCSSSYERTSSGISDTNCPSQRLTCQEENKFVISRAQDDRFECQTNLCMESWTTIGIGKVNNFLN